MKKIVFISLYQGVFDESVGFMKKDTEKVNHLNNFTDVECQMITFMPGLKEDKWLTSNHLLKRASIKTEYKFFRSMRIDRNIFKSINSYLDDQTFDVILMRYEIASLPLFRFTKKYRSRIYFEHNTKELEEFRLRVNERRQRLRFSLKPGYLLYYLESKFIPLTLEKILGGKIRNNVKSGFSVTNEILEYQQSVAKFYKVKTVSNGINFEADKLQKHAVYDAKVLKLFMLVGAKARWHGVDRLIQGLSQYQGECNITIDLIGNVLEEDVKMVEALGLQDRVNFIPSIPSNELTESLEKYHMSIGTLGLHRKGLNEACTLKVRESLSRGFPIILGYVDTDLIETGDLLKYTMKVPSDETPVDFTQVTQFASEVFSDTEVHKTVYTLAKNRISNELKVQEIYEFILYDS